MVKSLILYENSNVVHVVYIIEICFAILKYTRFALSMEFKIICHLLFRRFHSTFFHAHYYRNYLEWYLFRSLIEYYICLQLVFYIRVHVFRAGTRHFKKRVVPSGVSQKKWGCWDIISIFWSIFYMKMPFFFTIKRGKPPLHFPGSATGIFLLQMTWHDKWPILQGSLVSVRYYSMNNFLRTDHILYLSYIDNFCHMLVFPILVNWFGWL